jgi:hypothetical protein
VIGACSHINMPIPAGTSITDVQLKVTADVTIDATNVGPLSCLFQFLHNETPHGDNPCADGGTVAVGVDVSGCADSVK